MILGKNIGSVYSGGAEVQRVFSHGKLVWERESIDYNITPFTIKAVADTVSIKINNDEVVNFKYSLNGIDWIETDNTTPITINKHDKISIVGTGIYMCLITGLSDVFGNIMSLLYGDDFIGQTELPYMLDGFFGKKSGNLLSGGSDIRHAKNLVLPATTLVNYCYRNMFYECEYLISAPKILPATTLTRWCYDCMFWGCRSLRTPPELPATTLAEKCYHDMFWGCDNLTTAPELPATTLADECYSGMFAECMGLTTPPELPATTLAYECYYSMFYHCDNLTTAPELPATTLAEGCYSGMFSRCDNLTTAPELPATTLAYECYYSMFYHCDNLTTAPELPAVILVKDCYNSMFYYAKSLNYIKCAADPIQEDDFVNYAENFAKNTASTGKLVCKKYYYTGYNALKKYIPDTWTVEYYETVGKPTN